MTDEKCCVLALVGERHSLFTKSGNEIMLEESHYYFNKVANVLELSDKIRRIALTESDPVFLDTELS